MGILLVILSAFGFSTLGIFGKVVMDSGISRNDALFWRFIFAVPVFLLVLFIAKTFPKKLKPFFLAMLVGGVGVGVESTLFFLTLEQVGAGLTAIFLYLYPAFVALISHFLFKKKLTLLQWGCVLLAFVGCVLTVDDSGGKVSTMGVIYGVLTGAWYAVYLLAGAKMGKTENPLVISAGVTFGCFVLFAGIAAYKVMSGSGTISIPESQMQWWALLGLGAIATVLPFSTLYAGMKKIGVTRTSLISNLEMVFTLVLAAAFLGEKLTLIQIYGAALILLSVLLIRPNR